MKQKKSIFYSIALIILAFNCQRSGSSSIPQFEWVTTLQDTIQFTVITFDTLPFWVFDKKINPGKTMSEEDFFAAESILKHRVNEYNQTLKKEISSQDWKYRLIDLSNYKRQYVPTINEKGEQEIWINFFCDDIIENWESNLVHVMDGGNCYFNLTINLVTKKVVSFYVNGEA